MSSTRPLFRGLSTQQWVNLALAGLALFYVLFGLFYVLAGGLADFMGTDYRAFRASAEIAQTRGFAKVYDLKAQEEVQRRLYDGYEPGTAHVPFATVPMPYLPVFVLPFMPLLVFKFVPSFFVWSILNLLILGLYLWRFLRALRVTQYTLIARMMIILPVFSNFYLGQVNVWLLICMGELLLACLQGKEFRGGLWLAGLLLKPQTLIILLPGLFLGRRFKALAGFAVAGLAILVLSLLLAGYHGLYDLAQLIFRYTGGVATNCPEVMMNWRSLGLNLSSILPPGLSWTLAWAGLVLTVAGGISFWLRPADITSHRFVLALLGAYAATCAATWHSHVHMSLPLIPLLLFLYARGQLPWKTLYLWLYGAAVFFSLAAPLLSAVAYNLVGLAMLALNLYVLVWAARAYWGKPAGVALPAGEPGRTAG